MKLGVGAEGYSGTLMREREGRTEGLCAEAAEVTGEWRNASCRAA